VYTLDLSDRCGIVLGVANKRSLAWSIARHLNEAGARLSLTYQSERLREKVEPLAAELGGAALYECDVNDDAKVDEVFAAVASGFGGRIDYLVHSIAFAPREELEGKFLDTSREGYKIALEVSAFSLIRTARAFAAHAPAEGGSILTLTYLASQRVIPRYNVMGSAKAALEHAVRQLAAELGERNIRVNAVSAGAVSTLSARGISGFSDILGHYREKAPLGRTLEPDEVGKASLFLLSDMASGVTGEILHVDCGYNIMGV
jgi:enoyl-[acyl-carrier protein] reductase I